MTLLFALARTTPVARLPAMAGSEATGLQLSDLASSMVLTAVAVVVFAILAALISHALIDLAVRPLWFRYVYDRWSAESGDKKMPGFELPAAAFGLPVERLCALAANRARAALELRTVSRTRKADQTERAERMRLVMIDQVIDDLQTELIAATRYMRYTVSALVASGMALAVALTLGRGIEGATNYLALIAIPIAILATWIQSVELRAIRTT